jgi:DNA-3-methyladenine glycosylase II
VQRFEKGRNIAEQQSGLFAGCRVNMIKRYENVNLHAGCVAVAARDADLKKIIDTLGYPPLWVRPNTFATLVLIILEQQVSLAAAYAAFKKLQERLEMITPQAVLALTDAELRACYFTRQKTGYVRGLAAAILNGDINLEALDQQPDEAVRSQLKHLKGIGNWTIDIYLIHALRRTDIFPIGDLALVNALKTIKSLPATTTKETLLQLAEPWRPLRTFATLLLWHYYIQARGIKLLH